LARRIEIVVDQCGAGRVVDEGDELRRRAAGVANRLEDLADRVPGGLVIITIGEVDEERINARVTEQLHLLADDVLVIGIVISHFGFAPEEPVSRVARQTGFKPWAARITL